MWWHVDPSGELAIYDQIVRQVKFAVARGNLIPGNRLPSVRELARELTVNPNTIARAYQELQSAGIVQTVRGLGLEITSAAVATCQQERLQLVRQRLVECLDEALRSGLPADELRQTIDSVICELSPTQP